MYRYLEGNVNPTYERFNSFLNEYFLDNLIDGYEIYLFGAFTDTIETKDVDIRLIGKPYDYNELGNYMKEVSEVGLKKYNMYIDIFCDDEGKLIKYIDEFNRTLKGPRFFSIHYVHYLKLYQDDVLINDKETSHINKKIKKVGDNLWRLQRTMQLTKWVEKDGLPKPYKLEDYLKSDYYRE